MINRNFAVRKRLLGCLIAGGGLVAVPWAIAQDAGKAPAAPPAQAAVQADAQPGPDAIRRGQALFDGRVRFANKGPSCNACHHAQHEAVIGGGTLSTDLTASFSRMGNDGLRAILASAPFPGMQVAYAGKALTPDEIDALAGFLEHADKRPKNPNQQPADIALKTFGASAAGVAVLLGLFGLVGRRRKQQSVNQAIYDRQAKSE